jgi:short-subunit dehydrogenase
MQPGHIFITGASSGLGAALARTYARPGSHLTLFGRDTTRLEQTAAECRERGATTDSVCFDLRQQEELVRKLRGIDACNSIDLAILNAGVGGVIPRSALTESPEQAHEIATVNFTAAVVGATLLGEMMAQRGRGQIVLIGSVAEVFPLPMAPTYAGAKAGLATFAEALDLRLRKSGVAVTLVSPGFIDTPMSRQVDSPKPFLMTAEAAAAVIARKVVQRRKRLVIPWEFAVIRQLALVLPRAMHRAVLTRL